ncbi:hypothetical protein F4810DRAFT_678791 [Camillea tinctor]|nr:hypothetical protein F4810DRAFT_678791 [Camillea tinctor]
MSASIYRLSTPRLSSSAALRTVRSRSAAAMISRQSTYPTSAVARRGYASLSDAAHGPGGGEMPWAIASITVTALGLAFMYYPSSSSSSSKSHSSHAGHHEETEETKEKEEKESSHNKGEKEEEKVEEKEESPPQEEEKQEKPESVSKSDSEKNSSEDENAGTSTGPKTKGKSSQTGAQVPPPPADNSDLAENQEAREEGHEEYKKTIEDKQTRVASSSSTAPSKKTEAEHPREDPQKGEGEGVKKGGPSSSSSE